MRLRRRLANGLAIIGIGFLPLLYTKYRYYSHNWTPLNLPISLHRGVIYSPQFTTDLNGTYAVWLAFDHMSDFTREDCLLGSEIVRATCSGTPQILKVHFSVYRGNLTLVKDQAYQPGWSTSSDSELEVRLGEFEGSRHATQQIAVAVLRDGGDLNTAHPRIVVEAHPTYWEKWIILGQLALLVAGLFTLLGIGWIVWTLIAWRLRKPSTISSAEQFE
jgi:hypothetical protein